MEKAVKGFCAKHPELQGARLPDRSCPLCKKEYAIRNRERTAARAKELRALNPEKHRQRGIVWRAANIAKVKADAAAKYRNNPQKVIAANRQRLGFGPGVFERAMLLQNSRCAICSASLPTGYAPGRRGPKACADHDHLTGKPRGVLCAPCNKGLGHFFDSTDLLHAAIAYLKKPTL